MNIKSGTLLGDKRFSIIKLLGAGGYGEVFLANDQRMDRLVVLKVPRPALLSEKGFSERFRREIRAMVDLSHPNITRVLDQGDYSGVPFCVLEFMAGGTLEDRLRSNGSRTQQPAETLFAWLPRIADALDFIHAKGFVHRDVKPANVLFDEHGHAYLSDFGIAKLIAESEDNKREKSLTGTGFAMGTVDYMAPELFEGTVIDGRVDQYALAVTVFESLAARCPFEAPTPLATLIKHKTELPPSIDSIIPSIPTSLSESLHKALSKAPSTRFQTCHEFARSSLVALQSTATTPPHAKADPAVPLQQGSTSSPPNPFKHRCPSCNRKLAIPFRKIGHTVTCPQCNTPFDVPRLDEIPQSKINTNSIQTFSDTWPIPTTHPNLCQATQPLLEIEKTDEVAHLPSVIPTSSNFQLLITKFKLLKKSHQMAIGITLVILIAIYVVFPVVDRVQYYYSAWKSRSKARAHSTKTDSSHGLSTNENAITSAIDGCALATSIEPKMEFDEYSIKRLDLRIQLSNDESSTGSRLAIVGTKKLFVVIDVISGEEIFRHIANDHIWTFGFASNDKFVYCVDGITKDVAKEKSQTAILLFEVATGKIVNEFVSSHGDIIFATSDEAKDNLLSFISGSNAARADVFCETLDLSNQTLPFKQQGKVSFEWNGKELFEVGASRLIVKNGYWFFLGLQGAQINDQDGSPIYKGFLPERDVKLAGFSVNVRSSGSAPVTVHLATTGGRIIAWNVINGTTTNFRDLPKGEPIFNVQYEIRSSPDGQKIACYSPTGFAIYPQNRVFRSVGSKFKGVLQSDINDKGSVLIIPSEGDWEYWIQSN